MKIVSWNLRCLWDGDGINSFIHRAGFIYDKIKSEAPDVIGFQEVTEKSLDVMKKLLPDYEFYGSFRTENYDGEGVYIAFLKEKFALFGGDIFWLSPTPFVAGSRFRGQSECPRICAIAEIRNVKTNEIIRVANLHLDHISEKAMLDGIKCAMDRITVKNGEHKLPTVVMGDYNATPDSEVIEYCDKVAGFMDLTKEVGGTYHDFGRRTAKKIDYIYATKEIYGKNYKSYLWTDSHEGIYLSDHYPVVVEY